MKTRTLNQLRAMAAAGPPYTAEFLDGLHTDARAGARTLYGTCRRAEEQARDEQQRLDILMAFEREVLAQGFRRVAGVDEAGRGPLAGPIVAAAIVLAAPEPGLNDSKQLTAAQREGLFQTLTQGAHSIGVAIIDADTIDRDGIQSANYAAMAQAAAALEPAADFLLVDGFSIRGCAIPQKPLVKGDRRSASIAAASIVAKVVRDRLMDELELRFPGYGFAQHKGYGTAEHLDALRRLGPCPVHRKSFAPVGEVVTTGFLFEQSATASIARSLRKVRKNTDTS